MKQNMKTIQKLVAGVFLCCVMIGILAFYANMLQSELNEETVGILKEVAGQSAAAVKQEIESELNLLSEVADRLSVEEAFDPDRAVEQLKEISQRHSFKRMGIILPMGDTYTTDEKEMNLFDRKFFKESMEGKQVISDKINDREDNEEIIVFSMPVYEGGQVCAVLFATYRVEVMQQLLSTTAFEGQGYSYIIRRNGDAVADTVSPIGFSEFTNVFLSLKDASESNVSAAVKLKKAMENGETGYIRFHNKIDKYMYFSPLGVKDWYVLNVVPTGIMDSTRDFIMFITYILCAALAVIFLTFLLYIHKIEQQKKQELSNIMYVDNITGGYSFARFCVEAQKCVEQAPAGAAYIIMDIDKFKVINELFGYEEGNKTLCFIWNMWKSCNRADEIFARRIADRFVGLWYFEDREELNERLEGFVELLQNQISESKYDYTLKVTMGVYIIKDKSEDIQNMMNYAVMAHASIKGQEDAWYAFYDDDFREKLLQNKLMEDQMKRALKTKEFVVYYQPKYSAATKELVGAEALVRWKKADGGTVMPGEFIPLAERNGFINYLDKYIFTEVCKKQKEWMEAGKKIVPVSVNLSRRHLYDDEFMEEYRNIVEDIELPVEYVQLELTESAIFENQEALCQIIDKLHASGFRILMDDFGTGYSSLMMLKSIPIDILKLDKSFVDDFDDSRGEEIIRSVIQLAQALHIDVTAEGVETEAQYIFLKKLGCNIIQGFYFARPMPDTEFEEMLETAAPEPALGGGTTTASMSYI